MDFFLANHLPSRTVTTLQGTHYLWFSGTDYLGMGHNEDFRSLLYEATKEYGMHFGSSRNGSLRLKVYDDAEQSFAGFVQAESALLVSSGMWAGQLLMKEVTNVIRQKTGASEIVYYYAPKVHPALWGENFQSTIKDWQEWAAETVLKINDSSKTDRHIICSDAIGSPLVEVFNFSVFSELIEPGNVWLIVDESHSLGVLGENGIGIRDQIPAALRQQVIFVSSLNKALGIPAGAIWGNADVIHTIRQSPWFAGASPAAPAYISAFNALLETGIYTNANRQLKDQIGYFSNQLAAGTQFLSAPHYPVFCSHNAELYFHLLKNGIMASCFSYPSPKDPPITRIAITTLHTKKDLDRLAEVCIQF